MRLWWLKYLLKQLAPLVPQLLQFFSMRCNKLLPPQNIHVEVSGMALARTFTVTWLANPQNRDVSRQTIRLFFGETLVGAVDVAPDVFTATFTLSQGADLDVRAEVHLFDDDGNTATDSVVLHVPDPSPVLKPLNIQLEVSPVS
jgi:hypothetical protein